MTTSLNTAGFRHRLIFKTFRVLVLFVVFFLPDHAEASNTSTVFRLACFNVQNLFDLERRGTEYVEFVPDGVSGWNRKMLELKHVHLGQVVADLNADVLALTEVETEKALAGFQSFLETKGVNYPFSAMVAPRRQAVGCALLSVYPIISKKELVVDRGRGRSILKVVLKVEGRPFIVYVNHWPSRKNPESRRIRYARVLKKELMTLNPGSDYVVAGDLNSDYDEFRTFAQNRELNDTCGETGINHVLGTAWNGRLVEISMLKSKTGGDLLYNLWLERPVDRRWSYIFFGRKETLDHILVPRALFDGRGIDYLDRSFNHFAPSYLFDGRRINHWKMSGKKVKRHLGKGYSDHLPVYADFTVNK